MRKLTGYKPTRFMDKDSHYDKGAADFAVAFIESLCHTKGTWAGKPFELIDWQERIPSPFVTRHTRRRWTFWREGKSTIPFIR